MSTKQRKRRATSPPSAPPPGRSPNREYTVVGYWNHLERRAFVEWVYADDVEGAIAMAREHVAVKARSLEETEDVQRAFVDRATRIIAVFRGHVADVFEEIDTELE